MTKQEIKNQANKIFNETEQVKEFIEERKTDKSLFLNMGLEQYDEDTYQVSTSVESLSEEEQSVVSDIEYHANERAKALQQVLRALENLESIDADLYRVLAKSEKYKSDVAV